MGMLMKQAKTIIIAIDDELLDMPVDIFRYLLSSTQYSIMRLKHDELSPIEKRVENMIYKLQLKYSNLI